MLGRFVTPVSRLGEFIEDTGDFIGRGPDGRWHIAAVAGEDINQSVRQVNEFNDKYGDTAFCDVLEIKANSLSKIENTLNGFPDEVTAYFEISTGEDFEDLITSLAMHGQRAKIRTGGITPDAFPSATDIIRFVRTCLAVNVPFKATAGLHHPIRCYKPLTYDADAVKGTMHGFLNLFLMTGFAREGFKVNLLEELMEEEFGEVFKISENGVEWRDEYSLSTRQIEIMRAAGIQSFGSCSFDEPVADLQKLGIL
jgi:hypothetical protein